MNEHQASVTDRRRLEWRSGGMFVLGWPDFPTRSTNWPRNGISPCAVEDRTDVLR